MATCSTNGQTDRQNFGPSPSMCVSTFFKRRQEQCSSPSPLLPAQLLSKYSKNVCVLGRGQKAQRCKEIISQCSKSGNVHLGPHTHTKNHLFLFFLFEQWSRGIALLPCYSALPKRAPLYWNTHTHKHTGKNCLVKVCVCVFDYCSIKCFRLCDSISISSGSVGKSRSR